jgi:hypothetical protein
MSSCATICRIRTRRSGKAPPEGLDSPPKRLVTDQLDGATDRTTAEDVGKITLHDLPRTNLAHADSSSVGANVRSAANAIDERSMRLE